MYPVDQLDIRSFSGIEEQRRPTYTGQLQMEVKFPGETGCDWKDIAGGIPGMSKQAGSSSLWQSLRFASHEQRTDHLTSG